MRLPVVAFPFTNSAHAAHPAFTENVDKLTSWGVRVIGGPENYPLHGPGTAKHFPWQLTLELLRDS